MGNSDVCLQDVKKEKDRKRTDSEVLGQVWGVFLLRHKSNSAEILLGTLPE